VEKAVFYNRLIINKVNECSIPNAYEMIVSLPSYCVKNAGHATNMNQRQLDPILIGQTANHAPIERIILSIVHLTKPLKV
jgi:hypothetical protein